MNARLLSLILVLNSFWATTVEGQSRPLVLCSHKTSGTLAIRASCGRAELRLRALQQLTGATGSQGAQGPQGLQGPAGPQGTQGTQGLQGLQGERGPAGETGATGLNGADGAPGADGTLRIYGDGSAGALVVAENTTLDTGNTQYTDITVNAGQILTVPSGTVLRCTGNFTNNGFVDVVQYAQGGLIRSTTTASPALALNGRPAHPGASRGVAEDPEVGTNAAVRYGAMGGLGMTAAMARGVLRTGPLGGGGGGAAYMRSGGSGGGAITILCAGQITNHGYITAAGLDSGGSSGGGAGGLIVLGSAQAIVSNGSIYAYGGNGGNCTASAAAGGGGGGGIIHLIAPGISVTGTLSVDGGEGGAAGASIAAGSLRSGGGAGGAFGGNGGSGGNVGADGQCFVGHAGEPGYAYQTLVDPTALL